MKVSLPPHEGVFHSFFAQTPLPDIKWKLLTNHLKAIYLKDKSNPVLCMQLYIKTGSVKEKEGQYGYSHFIEHLCFKSTNDFADNSLSRYASSLGGMLNAFTDYDCTCYYLLLPREEYDSGLYILSQLVRFSTFTAKDVKQEKEIILEEIKQYENEPEPDFVEYIQCNYFDTSPLKRPVLGTVDSVGNADYSSLHAFYRKNYTPENSFLVVCGDYEKEQLNASIAKHFADWENSPDKPLPYSYSLEPEMPASKWVYRKRNKGEEFLAFVLPELCEEHPNSDALLIAIRYLAIGKSSRLFKRMVEEDKLCSSVRVNSLSGVLSGASVILASPLGHNNVNTILNVFKEEYLALMQSGIPEDEMYLVKQDIIHSWLYSFEGVENTANLIAAEEFIGNLDKLHCYGDKIQAITMEEVFIAMKKYWQPEVLSVYHEAAKPVAGFTEFNFIGEKVMLPIGKSTEAFNLLTLRNESIKETAPALQSSIQQIADRHYLISLSSGMQVLFKQLTSKSVSGFALSSHISQMSETAEQRGLNFFTSTLMLYGSQEHSHEELMRISRMHGFNIRVIHHLDSTTYRGKCRTGYLEKSLSTLAEIIYKPKFDNKHLQLLQSSALDGIRRDNDYPVSYAYQKWFKMLVGDKSNLYRSTGNSADIRSIHLKDIRAWYEQWNISKDFRLGIVGSHSPMEIAELCERLFKGTPNKGKALLHQPRYQSTDKRLIKQYRETDQAIIHLVSCQA
ncbi:MAG: insulinase family protein [Candidatus Cloacimonetes bacterium]|nr:insulinase family protein [Candidatus Cloacimonadota bacterium]